MDWGLPGVNKVEMNIPEKAKKYWNQANHSNKITTKQTIIKNLAKPQNQSKMFCILKNL